MFEKSISLVRSAVGTAFPCAAIAVGSGNTVFVREFFGNRQILPEILPLTENTLFDLASLTKLIATTMVALKLIEKDEISLNDNIGKYLPYTGNFRNCEIRHLLTHTSGLPSGLALFSMEHKYGDVIRTILDADPCCNTGEEVIYSCMGYIVLQKILETAGGDSLEKLADEYVFSPLGMKTACFNPDSSKVIAGTEKYPHNGEWATGHVHDENAYFLGGVSGNAGLFAALDDMIAFAEMCSLRGISENGKEYLTREIFDLAVKNYTPDKNESRGLGFQLKGNQPFPAGADFSQGSYGHTGFTGTSLYVDNATGLWGILLTNSVHYGRENRNGYFAVRREFYDMIIKEYRELKKDGAI